VILLRVFPGRSLNQQRQTTIERLGLQPFPGKQIPVLKVNLLSNVWNQSRGAVLAEPFSWTVIQGVTHIFIIVNSQL